MSGQFFAVAGQDVGTCEQLRWAWLSIKPMVVAEGDDAEQVLADAIESAGHDDVHVYGGWLCDYGTGRRVRRATADETVESIAAAERDGGRGVIDVDGTSCYVES